MSQLTYNYYASVKGSNAAREICKELNTMLGRTACRIAQKKAGGVYFLDLIVTADEALKYDIESDFTLSI